jgi:hypothetical protein
VGACAGIARAHGLVIMNERMKMFGVVAVSVLTGCVADPTDVDADVEVQPETALHATTECIAAAGEDAGTAKLPGKRTPPTVTLKR